MATDTWSGTSAVLSVPLVPGGSDDTLARDGCPEVLLEQCLGHSYMLPFSSSQREGYRHPQNAAFVDPEPRLR
jgi:hypothetical protein